MKTRILDLIDFERINTLLEGFNKTTGFVTAILDLEGNVLSKSGWRNICTDFHRINVLTAKKCATSDTELANKMAEGEKYHFYKCLNGLVDVAVPLVIQGEHVANIFSGQFFFEEPDRDLFVKQAKKYNFDNEKYMKALADVPVFSEERVRPAMDFLLEMTSMIAEMTMQRMEQILLNEEIQENQLQLKAQNEELHKAKESAEASEKYLNSILNNMGDPVFVKDELSRILLVNEAFCSLFGLHRDQIIGKTLAEDVTPEERESFFMIDKQVLADGMENINVETMTIRDGQTMTISTRKTRYIDKSGRKFLIGAIRNITERKLAEEALARSYERFRVAMSVSPDGFTILSPVRDTDGQVVDFMWVYENATVASWNGTDPETIVGKRLLELFPGQAETQFMKAYKLVAETGEQMVFEDEYRGETIANTTWFRIIVVPTGTDIAILSQNITKSKLAEEALRESEGRFRKIYEEGPFGMVLINSEYKFIMVNRTFCDITGYSESELFELTFRDITYPDDKDLGMESVKKLIKGEIPVFKSEKRYVRKDGAVIWVAITVAANFDKDGNFLYNLVIVEDITGRKQVEDDLKKSKEQLIKLNEELEQRILDRTKELTDLYDKAPCGYHSLDKDGLFLQINETELKMLGYTREELIQKKNFADLITAESQEKFKINFPLFKKMGFIKDLEFDFIRKDKTIFPILLSATAVYDSENNYLMSRSTLIDNTDLKQAKDEILKAKTTLEAVNKELETFTYSVSHDLKAPLRGIDGYSKLLSELYANQLNEEAKHFITTIRSSTMQMNQLIDDLLKYSRLERSQLQIQPLKIRSVIESILKMNEDEIVANDFSVQVDVPEIKLIADLNGIQIALRNLIENAIKFTKKATNPEILIKLAENQDYWIISVSDNGIGFDMKYSERIFEIFQRLQRAEDYPGTGIGLAMVAKTMQRMNGKVRAESKVGQGSTFYLEISKTNQQWN